jgi:hypothetical protein
MLTATVLTCGNPVTYSAPSIYTFKRDVFPPSTPMFREWPDVCESDESG